jgi:acetylornithine deacetylase/succinyl-diaminopimelate desuccinylase-like protein
MRKKHVRFFVLNLILFLCLVSCSSAKSQPKDPAIEKIIEEISPSEIENTISDLVAFETRYPHEKQLEVADYLHERLKKYLTMTDFHKYEYWGVNWKNVVGTIPGKEHPEEIVIVCAHLDSKSPKRLVYAPGADDDGSGCGAVLELARILSGHSFHKTIKFIIFSREETGQNGSKAYLKGIDRNKEKIVAALNLDMIAYGSDKEDIDLVTRPEYSWLAERVYNLAESYDINAKKIVKKGCY